MTLQTQPYKGARDYYPEDKRFQKYLFKKIRKTVESFGYEEYDAPLLEPLELYSAKTGDEIVSEQTYAFEDRGGRQVAIRPEMTPTISRMVAARRQELPYPFRVYNIGSRWRYERPQRGRLREFFQLDVDIFGLDDVCADVEIVQVADAVLQAFGAQRSMYEIKLNNRKLTDLVLSEYLKLSEVQASTLMRLIDRKEKMEPTAFSAEVDAMFTPAQRDDNYSSRLLDLLRVGELKDLPKDIIDSQPVKELAKLMTQLKELGIDNITFDPSIMRGFDYYTGIVFEVFDTDPENNRAMFGGGRYDGLVGLFGVEPVTSVGFAMGDVTLANFLEKHQLAPKLKTETDIYLAPINVDARQVGKIAKELREMDLNIAVGDAAQKLEKQIKNADKLGIRYVLFVGEKELKNQQFKLKNIDTGEEENHGLERIVSIVKDYRNK